jgi:DNA-binding protein Fis
MRENKLMNRIKTNIKVTHGMYGHIEFSRYDFCYTLDKQTFHSIIESELNPMKRNEMLILFSIQSIESTYLKEINELDNFDFYNEVFKYIENAFLQIINQYSIKETEIKMIIEIKDNKYYLKRMSIG